MDSITVQRTIVGRFATWGLNAVVSDPLAIRHLLGPTTPHYQNCSTLFALPTLLTLAMLQVEWEPMLLSAYGRAFPCTLQHRMITALARV